MRKVTALLLACILLLCSFAFADEAEVCSYDFDIRLYLNADLFPFRQREHMQGYADLLEMLEFNGNISWCEETQSSDLSLTVIPLTNPSAAISVRIWGIPIMHRVTSPLLADKKLSFNPGAFLNFTVAARETFQVPLPLVALANPRSTTTAFSVLSGTWKEHAGEMKKSGTIPYNTVKEIAKAWKAQLESQTKIAVWIKALMDPAMADPLAEQDLNALPQTLLNAAGGKALKVKVDGDTMQIQNDAGFVLWEQTESDSVVSYALNVPEGIERYVPAFSTRRETEDGKVSFNMTTRWACAEETAETDPETGLPYKRLDLQIDAEGLPASLPADTEFTGILSQLGTILPQFSFVMNGYTKADGSVRFALTFADRPEAGEVFSCEGTITPSTHDPMEYTWGELNTEYNILNLSYAAMGEMVDAIKKPLALGMIDFLYELPASACQAIMDDLEDSGILRTVLQ